MALYDCFGSQVRIQQNSQLGINKTANPGQKEHMEVKICIEGTAESLNQRDCAGTGRRAGKSRLLDQVRRNAAVYDAEHLAHDRRATGKQESQRVRKA